MQIKSIRKSKLAIVPRFSKNGRENGLLLKFRKKNSHGCDFTVQSMENKNICDVVEIYINFENPL